MMTTAAKMPPEKVICEGNSHWKRSLKQSVGEGYSTSGCLVTYPKEYYMT